LDGTTGDVGVSARFTVNCRNTSVATIENFAGTNTLSSNVSLGSGGSLFNIQSDTGLLIFSGTNQYGGSLTGGRSYAFSGEGNHLVSGPIRNSTNGAPIALTKAGAGVLTLSGVNTYANGTTVSGGTLLVDGSIVSNVTVASGATLGGNGTINGPVTVANGATLSPGDPTGTLTVKALVVNNSSTLAYRLGASSSLVAVTGNLTLGGTLNVTDAGGFAASTYTLFTYTGGLTYNGLTVGTLPAGFNATVSTSTAGQVNLVVSALPPAASFTATPLSGVEPLQVIFTDTSTGSPTTWAWDFDNNGSTDSTVQNPTNTYATGTYTVRLIACNGGGCGTNTHVNYINVITVPQSWQNFYGVAPDASDPFGVGMSNTNKFLAGFSPVNGAAYLHIINLVATDNDINVIYWGANGDSSYAGGPASRTNVLEFAPGAADGSYTNNFVSAGVTDILSGGTGVGVVTNMVDPGGATNQPTRFYRVRVLVP
jgi:autotransporter-associated beta strand protein